MGTQANNETGAPFAAVPWPTPVKPLTGSAIHAVWGGSTPPDQIRAAAYAFRRQRGIPASRALELTRADAAARKVRFPRFHPDAGPVFSAYGEGRVLWVEDPEAYGLRFVGLAQDFGSGYRYANPVVDHRGWFLDPEIQDETVSGVVYQLTGRDGAARYLAGYADPFNSDRDGRGPALLSLEVFHGEPGEEDPLQDPGARDAARSGDAMAEAMAESERDYQEGWRAGQAAREAAAEALEIGRRMIALCRELRRAWPARAGSPAAPGHVVRAALRDGLRAIRETREEYAEALERARNLRDEKPGPHWRGQDCPARDGWTQGYAEGV